MTRQSKYLILLLAWMALFAGPIFAGDWWDLHFHVYQSLTALCVIALCRYLFRGTWWADDICVVATLQVVHAVGDLLVFNEPAQSYNSIQAALNALELVLLVSGGVTELINGRADTRGNTRTGSDSDRRVERSGHA